jgi:hypothetical protein
VDKATAKRQACWEVARLVEDNLESTLWLDAGGDLVDYHGWSEEDRKRVQLAVRELIGELERRGHP